MKAVTGLVCFAVVASLGGCAAPPSPPPVDLDAVERGRLVWKAEECGVCHGDDGRGSEIAPTLANVDENWTVEELAAYLLDPEAESAGNHRLAQLAAEYQLEMPGILLATPEQGRDLALFILHGLP
jgi:cytochrome c553